MRTFLVLICSLALTCGAGGQVSSTGGGGGGGAQKKKQTQSAKPAATPGGYRQGSSNQPQINQSLRMSGHSPYVTLRAPDGSLSKPPPPPRNLTTDTKPSKPVQTPEMQAYVQQLYHYHQMYSQMLYTATDPNQISQLRQYDAQVTQYLHEVGAPPPGSPGDPYARRPGRPQGNVDGGKKKSQKVSPTPSP
jgi:hypothetical protein